MSVRDVSKIYTLYEKPADRLLQMIWRGRRRFGKEVQVLKSISFDVWPGESIGIIGVNGAGKSTLLQIICDTVAPTAGHIELNGRVAALLELGAGFNPEFTGRENVFMNGSILGLTDKEIHDRLDAILTFADIGEFIDFPVKTYSSGMYVRLAFAVAAHVDPEILVIDEALSVGDFLFQQKCNSFMANELANTTKIFVTHDFDAVTRLTERVLVLNEGQIIFDGGPARAIECYQIAARARQGRAHIVHRERAVTDVAQIEAEPSEDEWTAIPQNKRSGRERAHFEHFRFKVDGARDRYQIAEGQVLSIGARITCAAEIAEPIVGYQIQDRFGTVIFGENSKSVIGNLPPLKEGKHEISLTLEWPVLSPGRYALTLGVGNGGNAMLHEIECWAHNILVLESSSTRPVHGIFNVPIRTLEIRRCAP